jgi:hypothetical protein
MKELHFSLLSLRKTTMLGFRNVFAVYLRVCVRPSILPFFVPSNQLIDPYEPKGQVEAAAASCC